MKKKKKKAPIVPVNYFICDCSKDVKRSALEMAQHLKKAHHLTHCKGTRQMVLHLDGADYYSSTYEWQWGDITAHQYTCNPRTNEHLLYLPTRG